jgi:predicted amidophosphoribosyltransferase
MRTLTRRAVCSICGEPTTKPTHMCRACGDSYDKHAHDDGSVLEAMLWAARRARWYAERRRNRRSVRS